MERLILDTGVLAAVERGTLDLSTVVDATDNVAIPAVVVAEYLTGIAAQRNRVRAASAREFLAGLREITPVITYDDDVAECHAELLTHVREQGEPRGPHDLIIAATARAADRTIVTTDKRARFDELPGVLARVIGP